MRTIAVAVCLVASATAASAQNLKLEFSDGRVSIDATGVPVRTILTEWARLGGTRIVGGEKVTGAPLTIHLEKVDEASALQIVLRSAAGYMAAPRRANTTGASAYDRIMILATSTAPAAASNAGRAGGSNASARPGRAPFAPPQQQEPDNAVAQDDPADTGVNEPPFQFPQQNPFQNATPGQPGPFGTPMTAPNGQMPVFQFGQGAQQQSGVSVNPTPQQQQMPVMQFPGMPTGGTTGGFGISSPMPGVIVQPAQPGQPRPPGGA